VKIDEKNSEYAFYYIGKILHDQNITGAIRMIHRKRFSSIFMQDSGINA